MRLDSSPHARTRPLAELAANRVIPGPVVRRAGGKRSAAEDPTAHRDAVYPGACRGKGVDGDTRCTQTWCVGARVAVDIETVLTPTTLDVRGKPPGKHLAALRNPAIRARAAYPHPVLLRVSGHFAKSGHDNRERFLVAS